MALVCNFPKATQTHPSLLDHESVEVLLHEFGHVMHGLCHRGAYQQQNGFHVAWDFVEALSQIFEYWAWYPEALALLAHHYQTGESLPKDVQDKLIASKNFHAAREYTRIAVSALYDMRMHGQPKGSHASPEQLAQWHQQMRLEHERVLLPDTAMYAAGWGHMDGGYAAGYYGYLWSRVYAADMFTRFAPDPLNATVGHDYREKVLAPGASRPELDLVRDFLGREPSSEAFLAELGIKGP